MVHPRRLLELLSALDERPVDEGRVRRLAYDACDGDSLELMVTFARTMHSLAEQVARFHGTTASDVLRVEVVLPARTEGSNGEG